MSYTFFMNNSQITLVNTTSGNRVTVHKTDARYDQFQQLVKDGDFEQAEKLDVKSVVNKFGAGSSSGASVTIVNGVGTINISGTNYPLADAIVTKILLMSEQGFDCKPLTNFLVNLYQNPSKTAVDELFLFLENSQLPITEDGHFIAYKIVRETYMDIHSNTLSNKVGEKPEMPRFSVDDNRNNTCSAGLHFCSREYLPNFAHNTDKDRCMLLKINPADVVSIPSDYNNAKGRACKYEVVGEVTDAEWRNFLSSQEYTDKSVVSSTGTAYVQDDEQEDCTCTNDLAYVLEDSGFFYDNRLNRWRDLNGGHMVPRAYVASECDCSIEDLMTHEV
jgi:hypothetical protein